MKSTVRRIAAPLTALVLAAALSSCGGDDDSGASSEKKAITLWMYPGDRGPGGQYRVLAEGRDRLRGGQLRHRPEDRGRSPGTSATRSSRPRSPAEGPGRRPARSRTSCRSTSSNGRSNRSTSVVDPDKDKFLPAAIPALDRQTARSTRRRSTTPSPPRCTTRRLLTKAGISKPPATWDEIKAAAPKLKAAGVSTMDYSASPEASLNLNFYPLLWQAGGKVFADDGKTVAFNQAPEARGAHLPEDLYKAGRYPEVRRSPTATW